MRIPKPNVFALIRVTGASTLPTTIGQLASVLAASTGGCECAALIMTRDDSGVRTYLVLDDPEASVGIDLAEVPTGCTGVDNDEYLTGDAA